MKTIGSKSPAGAIIKSVERTEKRMKTIHLPPPDGGRERATNGSNFPGYCD